MNSIFATLITACLSLFSMPAFSGGFPWGKPINGADRFVVLESFNNEAVWDKETGLFWERSPSTTGLNWQLAHEHCNDKSVGNRKGWRLPAIQEIASLIDPSVPRPGPNLPARHPFGDVQQSEYWSATHAVAGTTDGTAWGASFFDAFVGKFPRSIPFFVWCVRGGQGTDLQ